MDIAAGIAAATAAMKAVQALKELDASFDKAKHRSEMAMLLTQIADVKLALVDARELHFAKDAEIADLKRVLEVRDEGLVVGPYRYRASVSRPGRHVGFPYCPRCEAVDKRLILTHRNPVGRGCICPQCRAVYVDADCGREDHEVV
jgi:hypothetical protein